MTTLAELMNLRGRRALVTGAAGGIGRVIATTLAEQGADLVLVDRAAADYGTLPDELAARFNVKVQLLVCDLEQQAERRHLIDTMQQDGATLDILINNAAFVGTSGLQGWVTAFDQQSVDTWRRALEVNLTAAFELCQGLAPALRRSGHGAIINLGSIYGTQAPDYSLYEGTAMGNPAAYAASKGGLLQLTRWLATTLAPDIRVNALSPGGVWRHQPESFVQRYTARTPLGRMASEQDFAGAIAYLASDLSAYLTGHNLPVDGGWSIW